VSRRAATAAMFWLALVHVGCCHLPHVVGCCGLLYLDRGFAAVQFGQLGLNGCSVTVEFAPSLLTHR
jgi:hypothetical protein